MSQLLVECLLKESVHFGNGLPVFGFKLHTPEAVCKSRKHN